MATVQTSAPAPETMVRRAKDRGVTRAGWLDSRHSFSFNEYHDPARMGVGPLRVLNDDRIAPGAGFPAHRHRDAEIVTYVVEGAVEHSDSSGNRGVVRAGEAQFMRAGTGVVHEERNASDAQALRLLQIWFLPRRAGSEPAYGQERVALPTGGAWATVASPDHPTLGIDADARMLAARLPRGGRNQYQLENGRRGYLFVVSGAATAKGETLREGDALLVGSGPLGVTADEDAHLVLFDLGRA